MATHKISMKEPAVREFVISLSHAEAIALLNWHTVQIKSTTRRFGSCAMKMTAFNLTPNGRNLKILHDTAKQQIEGHSARARELMSILKSKNNNS
ncbi:MAG: hypothetical protein WCH99_10190 [Verrucomicrobiota bacterium]